MKTTLTITKALADGNRLRVLTALLELDELCVCQITALLELAPATVSRHMSILQTAGLVENRKCGRWVYYRKAADLPFSLIQWIKTSVTISEEAEADRQALTRILACSPDELCKTPKCK
jgi:ArsR family transcriptional regulator